MYTCIGGDRLHPHRDYSFRALLLYRDDNSGWSNFGGGNLRLCRDSRSGWRNFGGGSLRLIRDDNAGQDRCL